MKIKDNDLALSVRLETMKIYGGYIFYEIANI